MDTSKGGKKLTIFSISIASLIIAIINGMKNYALYGNKYAGIFDGHFIAVNVITFLSAFLFIAVVFAVLYWSNQRGQQRIEKKLKEEDEESE